MCGVAGLLGVQSELALEAARRMQRALSHRGPDDEGLVQVAAVGGGVPAVLAHTRLSVVDLSPAGHQPMADVGTPPNWVSYNGEIYNFHELAHDLGERGHACRTRSDTEVLLQGYRAWGVRAVERFEGMFAFCLLDTARGLAWLARDRLGVKPLYLARPSAGGLLFASEVRALLAAGEDFVPRRLRRSALESFLAQGAVIGDDALVEGVSMLPPGTLLLVDFDGRTVRSTRYWEVSFGEDRGALDLPADGSAPHHEGHRHAGPARFRTEVVAELALGLRRATGRQLFADVPVGLFLSGGVDSGALATVASELGGKLRTLCVGFDVEGFDESAAARATALELGTDHSEIRLTSEAVLESFDEVLAAVDQPTVDGFNTFHVARAARRAGLTVALSGLGGDELFGGYASFRDAPRATRLARAVSGLDGARAPLSHLVERLGPALGVDRRATFKLAEVLRRPADLLQMYLLRRELFPLKDRRALHPLPDGSDPFCGIDATVLAELRHGARSGTPRDRVAAFELNGYMRHMLLRDSDVFSMAHGLEIRVPLLEHYVVAQAARARGRWRGPDPRAKPLLVDAAGPRLPARAYGGRKRGFTLPWASWLSGPLRARVEGALSRDGLRDAGLEPRAARGMWQRFLAGDRGVSALQLLGLVVLDELVSRERLRA